LPAVRKRRATKRPAGFTYIEEESFQSNFQGLFSEINLASDKLGRKYEERNAKLCSIISRIAEGMAQFSTDTDTLGDAYEYLIGQFAAGSGKKAGEFYTPQQISSILSAIVTLDSQEPKTGNRAKLDNVFSYRWEPTDAVGEDMRFKNHSVAPKSAAVFAFLLHGLHYLKDRRTTA
jgi:type I restriction-modification system DNA methylase subunit